MSRSQDVPSPAPSLPRVAGLVVVDKPLGWTSHDVVSRMRRLAGTRKVGHAGTLDPEASGVLVLGVEKATKLLTYVTGAEKTYETTIRLGAATVTDDAEGDVVRQAPPEMLAALTQEQVRAAVGELTGEIQQVPSSVSAIKVNGERSYARVRKGEDVELAARPVTVREFTVHTVTRPEDAAAVDVTATVTCSSGTYIRALARDLGEALDVGGHLTALRRTRVGSFTLEHAHTLEELAEQVRAGGTVSTLPLDDAARRLFPVRVVSAVEATDLSHGRRISPTGSTTGSTADSSGGSGTAPGSGSGAATVPGTVTAGGGTSVPGPETVPATVPDSGSPGEDEPQPGASRGRGHELGASPVVACFAPDGTLVALTEDRGRARQRYATPVLGLAAGVVFTDACADSPHAPGPGALPHGDTAGEGH